jgi:diguanylate cyclase (GGDEF)-like protein/PAS domain S-box-containing protein
MSDPHTQAVSPQAELEIEELEREYFDRSFPEHLDGEVLERVLTELVAAYPDAPASALTKDGIMVAMPETVALRRNPVLEARAGTDLLVFDHQLVAAWERVLAEGAARCEFHPVGRPDVTGKLYMLDLWATHGAVVTIAVYEPGEGDEREEAFQEARDVTPRFTTLVKDSRGIIVKIDEAMTKLLGWSVEEMEGHRSTEFIHPDDRTFAVDNWMQMLAVPGPARRVRLRHLRNDDTWVWFEVTNHNLLGDPDDPRVVSEMVDISDEMAAHEELRAREQLLDKLAEAAPVGLLQFDAARNVVYTNDRLHEILGTPRADTVEEQLGSVVAGRRGVLAGALDEVLGSGLEADIEVELLLPDREEPRVCTIGLRPLSDDAGVTSGAIACVADVTDSTRLREELEKRATFDALTGCHNRASVMHALAANIASGQRRANRAVVFVDLDGFKQINDRHSHAVGDEVLGVVASRLQGAVREADIVGRIGGDEFLVVCPDIGGPEQAMALAARMAEAQRERVCLPGGEIALQVSIGVAWTGDESLDAESLVALADQAMYVSKRERWGRPRLAGAAEEGASATRRGEEHATVGALAVEGVKDGGVGESPETVIAQAAEAARQMLGVDMAYVPDTRELAPTEDGRFGAYVGVPVMLPDGRSYGTFCCVSHEPEPALRDRDVQFMRVLARLIGDQIQRQESEAQARGRALKASNVSALLSALHARDGYTEDHSQAVVSLAMAVGRELGLDAGELLDLESVALLHDIGKIGICDAVLRKPGSLSEGEWAEMYRHPDIGAEIVAAMPSLSYLAPVIRAEHERWDGGGYPNGLRGEQIPLLSRIVFVCDAYHAMTSDRPYRRALAHGVALREITSNAGSQFCPHAAGALERVLEQRRARPRQSNGQRARKVRSRPKTAGSAKR